MQALTALERDVKALIISSLQLEHLTPDDIDSEAALFVEGLGLDSLDALELASALHKRYDLKLDASNSSNKVHFRSVRNLAQFISAQQAGACAPVATGVQTNDPVRPELVEGQ